MVQPKGFSKPIYSILGYDHKILKGFDINVSILCSLVA
jgi:hypothetical protein